jgi:uncharacterized protein YegP (UPF0339 family)
MAQRIPEVNEVIRQPVTKVRPTRGGLRPGKKLVSDLAVPQAPPRADHHEVENATPRTASGQALLGEIDMPVGKLAAGAATHARFAQEPGDLERALQFYRQLFTELETVQTDAWAYGLALEMGRPRKETGERPATAEAGEHPRGVYFVLKQAASREYYFDLVASNGQVLASSETYLSKADALKDIESARSNRFNAEVEDQTST